MLHQHQDHHHHPQWAIACLGSLWLVMAFDFPALHLLLIVPEVSDYLDLFLIHTFFIWVYFWFYFSISIQVNNTLESAAQSVVGVFINIINKLRSNNKQERKG